MTDYSNNFDENLFRKDSLPNNPLGDSTVEDDFNSMRNSGKDVISFSRADVQKLYASFPIFTAVPTRVGKNGEIVVYQDTASGDYRIYTYLNGAWRKVGDVDFTTVVGIANVVEDTTPQLGGDLDTNDKAISSESGKVMKYSFTKTVADGVTTDLFRLDKSASGIFAINIHYNTGYTDDAGDTSENQSGLYTVQFGGSDGSQAVIEGSKYTSSMNFGSGSGSLSVVFSTDIATSNRVVVKVNVNNSASLSNTFVAIIEVIATTASFTLTEL